MSRYELIIERPWLLLLIIPALAIILVPFFILPKVRRRTFKKIAPAVIHSVIAVLLVLLIAGLSVKKTTTKNSSVLLIDLSDSTTQVSQLIKDEGGELLSLMRKNVSVGAVAFAKDQICILKPGENGSIDTTDVQPDPEETDFAAALRYAASILPDGQAKRILLLSDGNETSGDALSAARELAGTGVRIDAIRFDTADLYLHEIQLTAFEGPDTAPVGEPLTLKLTIDSASDEKASVFISDNGLPAHNRAVDLKRGSNVFEFQVTPTTKETHVYAAKLSASSDTIAVNNGLSHCVEMTGGPNVLVLSSTMSEGNLLIRALNSECVVDHKTMYNAPKTLVELCRYDQIVLLNVDVEDLPYGYDEMLVSYVAEYGRSLFTVGGEHTYLFGNMAGTAYEDLLPVTLDYKRSETKEPVALMLVIDCSRSMYSGYGENIALAKQGAIRCLEAMSDQDYVSVVSLSGDAILEQELVLATAENKEEITRVISAISKRSGTSYTPALTEAFNELKKSDAPLKHVIFLSDGQPGDSDYFDVAQDMSDAGITISTISLGFYSSVLPYIAEIGYGRNYNVESPSDLPNIMLSEARMVSVSPMMAGKFNVSFTQNDAVTLGIDASEIPQLNGYLGTVLKEDATLSVTVGKGDPLYAFHPYGKGIVASFMSDLSYIWTENWLNNASAVQLVKNMATSVMETGKRASAIEMTVGQKGTLAVVTLETASSVEGDIRLEYTYNKKTVSVDVTQIGKGLYVAELPAEAQGVYEFRAQLTEGRAVLDEVTQSYAVPYSSEYNAFRTDGEAFLSDLCAVTGGRVVNYGTTERELALSNEMTVTFIKELFIPFGIIAAILFIIDVAIRRIRWKDIKNLFYTLKARKKAK